MMDTNNTPNIPVRSFHLLLLLLLLLLTFITTSTAYGETKEQTAFERGLTLFKQGELKTAEQTFSALLAKNPDNAKANFFNGLTLQKLGQFKDSIPYFDQAMMQAPDYAQGASYFIGLAYSKIGQHSLSQKNLKQSVAIDPSSDIGQTAQSLLDRFEEGRQGGKRWWLQTAIGYEYNDNLTIEQTDTVSEEDDHAAFIEIGGGFRLLEQPVEAEITYDFYQSLYSEYSEYNMQSHRLGTSAARSFNNWDVSLGYDYIYLLIDNDEFMQTQSLMPAVGVSFGDLYANTGFNFQIKDFLDDENDRRDAQNYSGGVDLYYLGLKKIDNINIGLRYEYEEAEDDELDYTGPVFSGSLRFSAPWGVTIQPYYRFHLKQYENNITNRGEEREDSKQTLGISLTKKLPYGLKLKASYKYLDNDSNYSASDYSENSATLSLSYSL